MNKKESNGKLPEEESNQSLDEKIEQEKIEEDIAEDNELIEDSAEDLEEKVLRAQAEVQNVRKTAQKEILKARLYGSESLVKDLLPSIDNLFRTLEFQNEESKSVPSEGIELVIRDSVSYTHLTLPTINSV